jgi:hypothetical protein
MSVYLACEQCQKRLKIPENVVGRSIKCPACGAVFKSDPSKVLPGKSAPRPVMEEREPVAVVPQRAAREAEEDEDVLPARKKPAVLDDDDEDEVLPVKKGSLSLDDDEDEVRPPKKKAVVEEEDEEAIEVQPAKKKPAAVEGDEDEDERPAKKKRVVDEDEEDEDEEEKPKKGKRRTPWYVMLPLIVLSLSAAGIGYLWAIGFTWMTANGYDFISVKAEQDISFDTKVMVGIATAGAVLLLCLIFSLLRLRAWLRFLLVFLFLGLGYGGSLAAVHWWKDLPFYEEPPANKTPPGGQPGGPPGGMQGMQGGPQGGMQGMPGGGMQGMPGGRGGPGEKPPQ